MAESASRQLELEKISTHLLGLQEARRFTALPRSGSVVMPGQAEDVPWALHQYIMKGGRLQKLRQVKTCEHKVPDILSVMVEGQELLAVACYECRDIKLMNLDTKEINVAYNGEKPFRVCHGEAGRMWVYCVGDSVVRELNCNSKTFTETGRFVHTTRTCYYMCYLPAPHRALVLSQHKIVRAMSLETGQQLWKLKVEIHHNEILPWALTFCHEQQLLLAADPHKNRILLLIPETGSTLQTFPSPQPWSFSWCQNQLLHQHKLADKGWCILYLQLRDPHQGESCK